MPCLAMLAWLPKLSSLFPKDSPPPEGWDPGAAWFVKRVLRRWQRAALLFYLGQWWWQNKLHKRRSTWAWPYLGLFILLEVGAMAGVPHLGSATAAVIGWTLVAFRAQELIRVYVELLLGWEHDISLRMERNLALLFVNFVEFTLLGAIALFLTTDVTMSASWYDAFTALTFYGLPHGGSFLHHVVSIGLALSALLLIACGLAVILTHVASKFAQSGSRARTDNGVPHKDDSPARSMMAPTLATLRSMSTAELEALYDEAASNVQIGLDFILNEIVRRERQALDRRLVYLTRVVAIFAVVSAAATIVTLLKST